MCENLDSDLRDGIYDWNLLLLEVNKNNMPSSPLSKGRYGSKDLILFSQGPVPKEVYWCRETLILNFMI